MDKITYLAELAEGLARWVPERERQDILRYYAEYFEEAGSDREAEVVAELGDPWALSCRLAVEGGYVTWENAASWRPEKRWPKVLLGTAVGLTVFALVFGIGQLAFNVTRNVSHSVTDPSVFGEVEQVTLVDWGMSPVRGEYGGFAFVDEPGAMGPYFIDGESVWTFSSIDVDISLGNIQMVAGDGYTLSVRLSEALGGYEPSCEIRDGVLRIRDGDLSRQAMVNSWDDLKKMFSADWLAVDVIITVPYEAALDKISVKTGLGDVLLWGLNATTVTAETGLGDVECYEARSVRQLGLSTGMGDVNLILEEVLDGLDIDLESGTGNVEATLPCRKSDCAYVLESGIGTVSVNGVICGSSVNRTGNPHCILDAASGIGGVNVWFTFD